MNTNARTSVWVKGWASAFALVIGLWHATPASADPIRFSTSGTFDLPSGPTALAGVTDASPGDSIQIGSLPVDGVEGALGASAFHVQIKFNADLPAIDVRGVMPSLGYSPDSPALDTVVSTSATPAQTGLYPQLFQNLIAHPDWLQTRAIRGVQPTMAIAKMAKATGTSQLPTASPMTAIAAEPARTMGHHDHGLNSPISGSPSSMSAVSESSGSSPRCAVTTRPM